MLRIKKIIVGNWKMNPLTYEEAKDLYLSISAEASKYKNINVVVACPSIFLYGFSLVKECSMLFLDTQSVELWARLINLLTKR
ncbi:MAG: triose-phosphate isomerase [Candidatus Vogelbacteria bacterium]|nr:triose-phosphate isomerase [Candidatus Vogelbacteria bacterium]